MKLKLIKGTLRGLRYKHWTYLEAFAYFVWGVSNKLRILPSFFYHFYLKVVGRNLKKKWLIRNEKVSYFDFNGAKLPDISNNPKKMDSLSMIFEDVFLISCYYNHNYSKSLVDLLDQCMYEGPYGYCDGAFDVTVHPGDVVIDVGAWLGDFSAYAASKGAIAYAFEPVTETFELLRKTSELNDNKIYPVQKALSDNEGEMTISISKDNSGGNSIVLKNNTARERITVSTLDKFVKENSIEKIDFIKADIEGAERDMLKGASYVLKTFAPKLAICTYHLPDDPEVLEKIIREANPNYKVIHLRHKLFAAVIN
jgi:FkbM family methyltransferase